MCTGWDDVGVLDVVATAALVPVSSTGVLVGVRMWWLYKH